MKIPILLPKVFNYPFTYKYNPKVISNLKPGDIVVVPFGRKKEIGVVWDQLNSIDIKIKLKSIERKIENIRIDRKLIKFINWFSAYNISSKGLILKMCLANQKEFKNNTTIKKNTNKSKVINYKLNEEQKKALIELEKEDTKFIVSVLLGVTGSGKTLIYFERIKKIIKKNKQVLILLPEIFLTGQFKKRFELFFGYEPAIWHSKITPKQKKIIWNSISKNEIKIVIGARSSLFLPFKNLGLIVVDEEHDMSYKQEEGVIYNARDMAISRASFENIPIHLITSIPSIETYNNILKKKYVKVVIKNRYEDFPLPKTKIINLNLNKLNKNTISKESLVFVKEYLDNNEQVLFFVNRRGYAPFLICKKCGYRHICPNCSIYLTFHKILNKSICHHCGYETKLVKSCKNKSLNCDFAMYGPGVEKVFEELKVLFPQKKIRIFSSDYLSKKKQSENLLDQISENKVDILVGTQMISKGFNFPKLNCIVVVDADFTGKGYDLRANEKNIQLYNQLSGRAGRFSKESLIVFQTISPDHNTLQNIIKNDPEKFLLNELKVREHNNLPPFVKLIALIISSNSKELSYKGALEIKNRLKQIKNIEILGPVESPIFKKKKKFRIRLLIRSKSNYISQIQIEKVLKRLNISKKIKLTVDVDPINFT